MYQTVMLWFILAVSGLIPVYAQEFSEAVEQRRAAAEKGDPEAQYQLGQMYESGIEVIKSLPAAIGLYERAAQQGHLASMEKLGSLYYKGIGVGRDYKKAFGWFKQAAEGGNKESQYYLGRMYSLGHGVAVNAQEAQQWYTKAAAKRGRDLDKMLGDLAELPEVTPPPPPATKPEVIPESTAVATPEVKPEAKPEIKPEIKPEVKPEPVLPVKAEIVRSAWRDAKKKPAELLPSSLASCTPEADKITCMTSVLTKGGELSYTYKRKAIVSDFNDKKRTFVIKYRDLIIAVTTEREDLKPGWEPATQELKCVFATPDEVSCTQGKLNYSYQRVKK